MLEHEQRGCKSGSSGIDYWKITVKNSSVTNLQGEDISGPIE